jgi:hypothetical protein
VGDGGDAWPIEINELVRDIAKHFEVSNRLLQETRPGALWVDLPYMKEQGIGLEEVARMLLNYRARDNAIEGEPLPAQFEGRMSEKVFEAAFPYAWMPQVWNCARHS